MARPPKPFQVIENEGKSHRTKAELNARRAGEEALATGTAYREWTQVKENAVAHKEFVRLRKLYAKIDKNDALHEGIINRYCLMHAECIDIDVARERIEKSILNAKELHENGEINGKKYIEMLLSLQGQSISFDKQLQSKRKMMLDIEKENLMTMMAVLRSIPKKPQDEDEADDPMNSLLNGNM